MPYVQPMAWAQQVNGLPPDMAARGLAFGILQAGQALPAWQGGPVCRFLGLKTIPNQ